MVLIVSIGGIQQGNDAFFARSANTKNAETYAINCNVQENDLRTHRSQPNQHTEQYVLSLDMARASEFSRRNSLADLESSHWVQSVDGFQQTTLDLWARLTESDTVMNASHYSGKRTKAPPSPHGVGCFLSHWNLLRSLSYRAEHLQPDYYYIFEDDSNCIPNLLNETDKIVRALPDDWDLLMIGGKPYT